MRIKRAEKVRTYLTFGEIKAGTCFSFTGKDQYSDAFSQNDVFIKTSTYGVVDLKNGITFGSIEDDRAVEILDAEIVIN